jgi:hypothetical protein
MGGTPLMERVSAPVLVDPAELARLADEVRQLVLDRRDPERWHIIKDAVATRLRALTGSPSPPPAEAPTPSLRRSLAAREAAAELAPASAPKRRTLPPTPPARVAATVPVAPPRPPGRATPPKRPRVQDIRQLELQLKQDLWAGLRVSPEDMAGLVLPDADFARMCVLLEELSAMAWPTAGKGANNRITEGRK